MPNNEVRSANELIREVPVTLQKGLGEAAAALAHTEQPSVIVAVPGVETSSNRSPESVVAEINAQLAARPGGSGRPEVRAGGVDGIITQRGGQ